MPSFLAEINDPELRAEVRTILARLLTLAEGSASPVERASRSSEKPIGPPGFSGLSSRECPPEDRSLYDHFRWRFEQAVASGVSTKRLYFLLWEAEKAYETRAIPASPENPRVALILTRADEQALITRIINEFEGDHAVRVAIHLSLPEGWVRKVREDNGCEPEHGQRRPKWRELDEGMKRLIVSSLRRQGKTQNEVAQWLGVSRPTVAKYQDDQAA